MTDKQIVIVRDGEKYYLGHGHEKEVFNFPEKKPQLYSLQLIETAQPFRLSTLTVVQYIEKKFTSH